MNKRLAADSLAPYLELEEQARRYPLHSLHLQGGSDHSPLGLLLVADGTSGRELEQALAALDLGSRHFGRHQPGSDPAREESEALPDAAWLQRQLHVELDRVTRTRLPCALLLLTPAGASRRSERSLALAALALAPCLHQVDLLARWRKDLLALVLPGTNLGKARKRAAEIRAHLRPSATRPGPAVGIAVCHAYESIAPGQLLALAEEALGRAGKDGAEAICHAAPPARPEDSCQVTVEERAQLFSFLQKEACL